MATSTMSLSNGGNLFEGRSNNSSVIQPNVQASNWASSTADSRGTRGYGGQRPRGRGGFRGRRRGSRFRGGRGRSSDIRTNGCSDQNTIKQPNVDLRASLDIFYEKQRMKEFPPLLKPTEQTSSEVETEIREFLRKNFPKPDHARHLTLDDFRRIGLSETAIAQLNVTSDESQENDMFAARRLSGTIGLQMEQWKRYFHAINQLNSLGFCSDETPAESENALTVIDEMISDLDRIQDVSENIAEMCKDSQQKHENAENEKFSKKEKNSATFSEIFFKMGLVCAALGLGFWCLAKIRR